MVRVVDSDRLVANLGRVVLAPLLVKPVPLAKTQTSRQGQRPPLKGGIMTARLLLGLGIGIEDYCDFDFRVGAVRCE